MHAVWQLLLDDEFMHAYEHGIVVKCHDGILRRIYPQLFTYSADYPEKSVTSLLLFMFSPIYLSIEYFSHRSAILVHAHVLGARRLRL